MSIAGTDTGRRSWAGRLRTPFLLSLCFCLSGCFIQIRELKTENEMLRQKVLQATQDMQAEGARRRQAEEELQRLRGELQTIQKERDELLTELTVLRERITVTQRLMSDTQKQQAESLVKDMEARLQRENDLKLQMEQLGASVEDLRTQKLLLESELESAQEKVAGLSTSLQKSAENLEQMTKIADLYQAERDDARAERDDFRRQLQALQSDRNDVVTQLEEVSSQLRDREKEMATLQRNLEESRASLETLEKSRQQARAASGELSAAVRTSLQAYVEEGTVSLRGEDGLRVSILCDALYQPGTVLLSDKGVQILTSLSQVLEGQSVTSLIVEGHSDNVPVRNMPFVDNWDLSASRASSVTRWLAARENIPAKKLQAVSRAFYDPVASNDTAAGRRQNRRVDIVIVP